MATKNELDHQYRMARLREYSNRWRATIRLLIVCALGVTAVYCLRELAGQTTLTDIRFRMIADLKMNRWMALVTSWILTGGTTAWALGERTLRKRHIRRVSSESSIMQKYIDAGRRSSHLTNTGATRPGDE